MRGDKNWMQTYSGKRIWIDDIRPEDIDIRDIAHALAMQCRYAGHCVQFYSVAEHSVLLANYVAPEHAMWALLHDASEAYLVDIPRPIKPFLANYYDLEANVMAAVCGRFGLKIGGMPKPVKEADNRIIADEYRRNMFSVPGLEWEDYQHPLGIELQLWSPDEAELQFLEAYDRLAYGVGLAPAA
jgi:hypothetical protein